MTRTPHKHADILRAIADGYQIQKFWGCEWVDCKSEDVLLHPEAILRIKPEPKPDYSSYAFINKSDEDGCLVRYELGAVKAFKVLVTYSGETGEPIKVEICK